MRKNLISPRRAVMAALLAAAAGCGDTGPVAGADELASVGERELVVMEPVLVQTAGEGQRTEYRRKVVRLRPVLADEPIDPAFYQASYNR